MKRVMLLRAAALAGAVVSASALPAVADNANLVRLQIAGNGNSLLIGQTHNLAGRALNTLQIDISGNLNGGVGREWAAPQLIGTGLQPGSVSQSGGDNAIGLGIIGHENLFAMRQIGEANRIEGQILGHANAVAVVQSGIGNSVGFNQTGFENVVAITQYSY